MSWGFFLKGFRMKNKSDRIRKIAYTVVIAVLLLAILGYVIVRLIINPANRSPKKVAEKAFLAVYSMDYQKFLDYSIYNDDCQKYLRMEIFDICNELEGEFQNGQAEKDEFEMTVSSVSVEKYSKTDAEYGTGLNLLKAQNPEAVLDELDGIALAHIQYSLKYSDGQQETGEEEYWVYRVHNMWYAHPLVNVSMEGIYE